MRILLFANTDWYLYNYRLLLAEALINVGHHVILISPDGPYGSMLSAKGYDWRPFPLSRRGINPLGEANSLFQLVKEYQQISPDLVHHFTIKCVIYGSLAAKIVNVPNVVNSITGRGYIYSHLNWKTASTRFFLSPVYKYVLKGTNVIFQNKSDLMYFLDKKLVKDQQTSVIQGSGVDIRRFRYTPIPPGQPIILLPARMLWSKGVSEFVGAAKLAREAELDARFVLVGEPDPANPDSISKQQLEEWSQQDNVEWWGWQEDMTKVYRQATVICLPSFYGEGLAKSLVEGAATGRPLIATKIPGCREVIIDGENGFLVSIRNEKELFKKIKLIVSDVNLANEMGLRGRRIVEQNFSAQKIIEQTLNVYHV